MEFCNDAFKYQLCIRNPMGEIKMDTHEIFEIGGGLRSPLIASWAEPRHTALLHFGRPKFESWLVKGGVMT